MQIRETLALLLSGGTLDSTQAEAFFESLLEGQLDDAQIGAALALIARRGPTTPELLGGAKAMRRHVSRIPGVEGLTGQILDTCGTGGAQKTFNVSTISALVVAAAGRGKVLVAKHGNKGRSGRGSAEMLRTLGVNIDAGPATQARCLREAGVCFCFAIHHHPAMRHAARARQSLGFPTIFNALGPLTNPAGAQRQLMGVYEPRLVEQNARVLAALGSRRAIVAHGRDGIDEISICAPTLIASVEEGSVKLEEFDAAAHGIPRATLGDLQASDLEDAGAIALAILSGEPGAKRDMVLVNAAAALVVSDVVATIEDGLRAAREAIDSGAARRTFDLLARLSNEA